MRKGLIVTLMLVFFASLCAMSFAQTQQQTLAPKKVEIDSDYDGNIDRVEVYNEAGQIDEVELDTTGDGKMDQWIIYENGKPLKSERDTNGDGKPDVWIEY